MKKILLNLALVIFSYSLLSGLYAQSDLATQIDDIVQSTYSDDLPGATIIVVKDGKVLYRGAKGMANMELGISLQPEMVFRLGSITKQFTAASILILREQEKLRLQDTIDKFLPDYPADQASTITVEHLLTHTSGTGCCVLLGRHRRGESGDG